MLVMESLLTLILNTKICDVLELICGRSGDWYTEAFLMVRWNQEGGQVFWRPVTRSVSC